MATPRNRGETTLAALLKKRIAASGPISVAAYMAACLGDETHGYYRTRDPLGARGDFTTAPEISQIFGELIGLWCIVVWRAMGQPDAFRLIELGPGRGTLMADALRAAAIVPEFAAAATIDLVETSPVLRAAQKDSLQGRAPQWHDALEDAQDGPAIVIANEFLDALPVHQLVRSGDDWRERCVTLEGERFAYALPDRPPDDASPDPGTLIPATLRAVVTEGEIVEIRPTADTLVAELGRRARQSPLAALFIDYGHARSAPGDTFQALAAHGYADPLAAPGDQDLTAHVDFEAVMRAAARAGLSCHGPMQQGEFLLKLGLAQRSERLMKGAGEAARAAIESGTHRLSDPARMGALFKALAVTGGGVPPPPPFRE